MCRRAEENRLPRPPESAQQCRSGPGQPQLVMRATLSDLPECEVPSLYSVRHYQLGDELDWEDIIRDSFRDAGASFEKAMKSDRAYEPERVLFVCHNGKPVATAAAWYRPEWGKNTGYLHMVGTHSSHTGKGLGLQASLAALHRMVAEGRASAILQTDDFRIPAIKTYLKLGFSPVIVHENQPARWRDVLAAIGRSDLISEFKSVLDGPISEIGRRDG